VGSAPLHPPEAEQLCAPLEFHCNVTVLPEATLFELDVKVTTGAPPTSAVLAESELVCELVCDWPPHAASAINIDMPSAQRMTDAVIAEKQVGRKSRSNELIEGLSIPKNARVKYDAAYRCEWQWLFVHNCSISRRCQCVAIGIRLAGCKPRRMTYHANDESAARCAADSIAGWF
jgi:hypothetical protein